MIIRNEKTLSLPHMYILSSLLQKEPLQKLTDNLGSRHTEILIIVFLLSYVASSNI